MGRQAFVRGQFVPFEEANVHIMTHALHYGTGCFEGIRGYWDDEGKEMYLFRAREHFQRLLRSCRVLRIDPGYGAEEMLQLAIELVRRNGDQQDVYIRPLCYKSGRVLGPILSGVEDDFLLYSIPLGAYLDTKKGLRVCVSSWRRINDNMIPARAKVTGAYINAALARTEAADRGCDEAIFLTQDDHVSEGTGENLFIVRNGQLITPTVTDDILEGITRNTIIQLAREELGIPVVERPVDRTELYVCEEAFFVGTAAEVSPIIEVDRRPVGDGRIGEITRRIQELYFQVVKGKVPKYREWLTPVYQGG